MTLLKDFYFKAQNVICYCIMDIVLHYWNVIVIWLNLKGLSVN